MNGYVVAGIIFAVVAAAAGGFMAYQYWELNEIKNNLVYRNQPTCAPNNILIDEQTKARLCQQEYNQRQIDELKELLAGVLR